MRRKPAQRHLADAVMAGEARHEVFASLPQNTYVAVEKRDIVIVSGDEDRLAAVMIAPWPDALIDQP